MEDAASIAVDHRTAYTKLNEMLVALRPDRKDSVTVQEKFQLIVKEWAADAGICCPEPVLSSGVAGEVVRNQLRRNKATSGVMRVVKDAHADEKQLVHDLVQNLTTPAGRGRVLREFGGQLESAPGIDASEMLHSNTRCYART